MSASPHEKGEESPKMAARHVSESHKRQGAFTWHTFTRTCLDGPGKRKFSTRLQRKRPVLCCTESEEKRKLRSVLRGTKRRLSRSLEYGGRRIPARPRRPLRHARPEK